MKQTTILLVWLVVIFCGALPVVADVPISTTRTEARQIVVDHDRDTGNYFAVVRGAPGPFPYWYWDLYLSTSEGASWTQGTGLFSQTDFVVDLAVAGDYVYVGYAFLDRGEVYLESYFANDGSQAAHIMLLDVSPARVVDVALASDQDGANNEIYYALIDSDGSLRFFYDLSSDGTTFTEASPGVSNAFCGLDMTFNPNSVDHDVFISYLGTDGNVHVWRSFPWEEVATFSYSGFGDGTAISASDDNVVLAYEASLGFGSGIIAQTSDDAGDSWVLTYLDAPQSVGDGHFYNPDVTARGSQGFSAVYHHHRGDLFHPIYIRRGIDFYPAAWEPRVSINELNASSSSSPTVNWFPPHHYGIAYVGGDDDLPYFDLFDASLFSDDFESGATSSWSVTTP